MQRWERARDVCRFLHRSSPRLAGSSWLPRALFSTLLARNSVFPSTASSCAVTELCPAAYLLGKARAESEREGGGHAHALRTAGPCPQLLGPWSREEGFRLHFRSPCPCHHHHCRRNAARQRRLALGRGQGEKREKRKKSSAPPKLFSAKNPSSPSFA